MPAILAPADYDRWLDPAFEARDKLQAMLGPYPSEEMVAEPVSTLVIDPRHETPECIEVVEVEA